MVCDQDDRTRRRQRRDGREYPRAAPIVESFRRFVHEDDRQVGGQGTGHGHKTPFATRERGAAGAHALVRSGQEAFGSKLRQRQPRAGFVTASQRHVVEEGAGDERRLLRHPGEGARVGAHATLRELDPIVGQRTDRRLEPEQSPKQSGLSRSVGAQHCERGAKVKRRRSSRAAVSRPQVDELECTSTPGPDLCASGAGQTASRFRHHAAQRDVGSATALDPTARVAQVAHWPICHETDRGERHQVAVAQGRAGALGERDGSDEREGAEHLIGSRQQGARCLDLRRRSHGQRTGTRYRGADSPRCTESPPEVEVVHQHVDSLVQLDRACLSSLVCSPELSAHCGKPERKWHEHEGANSCEQG